MHTLLGAELALALPIDARSRFRHERGQLVASPSSGADRIRAAGPRDEHADEQNGDDSSHAGNRGVERARFGS
jgi:hypothetical protein